MKKRYTNVGPIYYVILYPYLLSFGPFNNIIFRILLVLFAFVGNKFNPKSTAKEYQKEENNPIGYSCRP